MSFLNHPRVTCVTCLTLLLLAGPAASVEPVPKGEFKPQALGLEVPVLSEADDLREHVGRLVAVRGVVSDTKLPHIAGVEVKAGDELRAREAYAVGVLIASTITVEDYRRSQEGPDGPIPSKGPGTHYRVYFDLGGKIAEARPVPTK